MLLLMTRNCFISTLLIYVSEFIYVSYLYITVLFSGILFRYNTLFTYTSKNILLVIGIILV